MAKASLFAFLAYSMEFTSAYNSAPRDNFGSRQQSSSYASYAPISSNAPGSKVPDSSSMTLKGTFTLPSMKDTSTSSFDTPTLAAPKGFTTISRVRRATATQGSWTSSQELGSEVFHTGVTLDTVSLSSESPGTFPFTSRPQAPRTLTTALKPITSDVSLQVPVRPSTLSSEPSTICKSSGRCGDDTYPIWTLQTISTLVPPPYVEITTFSITPILHPTTIHMDTRRACWYAPDGYTCALDAIAYPPSSTISVQTTTSYMDNTSGSTQCHTEPIGVATTTLNAISPQVDEGNVPTTANPANIRTERQCDTNSDGW